MKRVTKFSITMGLIIILSVFYFIFGLYYTSQEDINLKYEFKVVQDNITSYEIYIPIPKMPHKLSKKEGTFQIHKIDTSYGEVYKINGSGSIKLMITGYEERHTLIEKELPGIYYGFSTQNDSNNDNIINWRDEHYFWIYQNQGSNISVSFLIRIDFQQDGYCGTDRYIHYEGDIPPEWNLIEFEEEAECWDGFHVLFQYMFCCIPMLIIEIAFLIIGIIIFRKKDKEFGSRFGLFFYIKLFLLTSVPFGIIFSLYYFIIFGYLIPLFYIIFGGLTFGFLMTIIIGSINYFSIKRLNLEKSKEAYKLHHIRSFDITLSYNEVYKKCLKSVNLIQNCKIKYKDYSTGKIEALTGLNLKSWGEIITFDLQKIDKNKTQVKISSKPAVPITFVDYGKNLENIEIIASDLNNYRNL